MPTTQPRTDLPLLGDDEVHRRVAAWLSRPANYPERPARVETIETHISRVFLADRFVYKLKKPVRFEFVDFSRAELRRNACEDEVRLNSRMAPGVYLGVLPIGLDRRGQPRWLSANEASAAVDYVVKMRRLPAELTLDRLLTDNRLTESQLDRLSRRLAEIYGSASPLVIEPGTYRNAVRQHVVANDQDLRQPGHGLPLEVVDRVSGAQLQFLELAAGWLTDRVTDGRVIDGHGDLRPEHVVLTDPPVVFDCVEFNAEFRRIDVLDELCFLAMECEQLGAGAVGERILKTYRQTSGDDYPDELAAFFQSYRACVRAKVAALRASQAATSAAKDRSTAASYLEQADRLLARFHTPLVLVCGGLMGTGKSTLANAWSERCGAVWLRTDSIRQQLFGPSSGEPGFQQGHYTQDRSEAVYREMFQQAGVALAQGRSVVLDGAFLLQAHQRQAVKLAERHGANILLARCECPADEARRRIAERRQQGQDPSEARPELYDQQQRLAEPILAQMPVCFVDTTQAVVAQLEAIRQRYLKQGLPNKSPR